MGAVKFFYNKILQFLTGGANQHTLTCIMAVKCCCCFAGLTDLTFYVPLNTKWVILETFPQANLFAWYGKKLNLTQQKHPFTNHKKCTTAQNKHKKTEASFSRLLRHPAWKTESLFLFRCFINFVTYLLTYLHTYPLTYSPGPTPGGLTLEVSEVDTLDALV